MTGQETQTRVPLRFQLREGEISFRMSYRNSHEELVEKKIIPADLDSEIRFAQKDILGEDQFSSKEISLLIQKPKVHNITVLDLPGMIIHDNQNKEKEDEDQYVFSQQIRQIYDYYLGQPQNTVVCCVQSNQDVQTNITWGLIQKYAKKFDKHGQNQKVILLITKIDRHEGDFGQFIKASKNYNIPVFFLRGRTQQEKEGKVSFEQVRKEEEKLINSNPHLSKLQEN